MSALRTLLRSGFASSAMTISSVAACLAIGAVEARAALVDVTGTFLYEDRIYDGDGYTGEVQNLAIRHADVEIVRASDDAVLGSGSTDEDGEFLVTVDLSSSTDLYARCLSATDNSATYHIKVVDDFVRTGGTVDLSGSTIFAFTTPTETVLPGNPATWELGATLIADVTGDGIAQAYNILDQGVDSFDYLATADALDRYPDASEFVVYGWNQTSGSSGSNYFWQGIYIAGTEGDTDGWSDTVILHETGHWVSDLFGADDNPGGSHFIGDNFQDPRLSYGEGYATYFCALVREFRAPRDNGNGENVDDNVSIYADLGVPPPVPMDGALEFAYDFETGLFTSGTPIGQIGTANETNVTSAMWDLVDGVGTPDDLPGFDDEPGDETGALSWDVTANYMPAQGQIAPLTVEDFYAGWFARHGPGFMQTAIDSAFIGLAGMEFYADAFEPDDDVATASTVVPLSYGAGLTGGVVINEVDLGTIDRVELYNAGSSPVDLTGWTVIAERNDFADDSYTFGAFTLYPGAIVVVQENGDPADDSPDVVFFDDNFVWANGDDGAVSLLDDGGVGVDFVRWDSLSGDDPSEAVPPAGTSWSGSLPSAPGVETLGRDKDGTDTDAASDWSSRPGSFSAPNFDAVPHHTIYPEGDVDVVRVPASEGDLLVFRAFSPHSAGRPVLEILDGQGDPGAPISASFGDPSLAQIQLISPADQDLHVRVRNDAPYTEYAPMDLLVFSRPAHVALAPPVGLVGLADNEQDIADPVQLTWFNGGAYDAIEVRRDGAPVAPLAGDATSFGESISRGLYLYEVVGEIDGVETEPASYQVFAGVAPCATGEDFESLSDNLVLESPWSITTALASEGLRSAHDSPGGNYGDEIDVTLELIEPGYVVSSPTLQFDHICITEATYDFGHVEVSSDYGNTWTRLASYDMDDYPEWEDGSADPGDWKTEVLDLSDYLGQKVRVRFRLISDAFVNEDGWYIDDVRISDPSCDIVASAPDEPVFTRPFTAYPNPFRSELRLRLAADGVSHADVSVYDPSGRRVRQLHDGRIAPGVTLRWDGRDSAGREVPTGVYWVRARHDRGELVERVLRVR